MECPRRTFAVWADFLAFAGRREHVEPRLFDTKKSPNLPILNLARLKLCLVQACLHALLVCTGGGWTTDLNTLLTLLIKKNSSSQNFQVKKQNDIWNQHITSSHGSLLRIEEPTVGLMSALNSRASQQHLGTMTRHAEFIVCLHKALFKLIQKKTKLPTSSPEIWPKQIWEICTKSENSTWKLVCSPSQLQRWEMEGFGARDSLIPKKF